MTHNEMERFNRHARTAKLLIVDDNQLNIKVLYELFRHDYEVYVALNGEQALQQCMELQPDLILLDIVMPRIDGFEVCRQLKNNAELCDIPVVFVSSHFDEAEEARGFEVGAVDFIHKPVNPVITRARVRTQLQLKMQQDLLKTISQIDGLTTIANRRHFDKQLQLDWRRCQRDKEPLSLILLDIDYFKQYNDEFGHVAGDNCLQQVAKTLAATLSRPYDLLARYGGEEFVALLPNTDLVGAEHLAHQMLESIRALAISHPLSTTGQVSLSAGVACWQPQDPIDPLLLLQRADKALYSAKQQGRDCVCCDPAIVGART